jgi:hypothetical protein
MQHAESRGSGLLSAFQATKSSTQGVGSAVVGWFGEGRFAREELGAFFQRGSMVPFFIVCTYSHTFIMCSKAILWEIFLYVQVLEFKDVYLFTDEGRGGSLEACLPM